MCVTVGVLGVCLDSNFGEGGFGLELAENTTSVGELLGVGEFLGGNKETGVM